MCFQKHRTVNKFVSHKVNNNTKKHTMKQNTTTANSLKTIIQKKKAHSIFKLSIIKVPHSQTQ